MSAVIESLETDRLVALAESRRLRDENERLRAEVRDLKARLRDRDARLKAARSTAYAHEGVYRDTATALLERATNLRRNWRKP